MRKLCLQCGDKVRRNRNDFCSKKCLGKYRTESSCYLNKDELIDLYCIKKIKIAEIAERLNTDFSTVCKYVNLYEIEKRGHFNDYKGLILGNTDVIKAVFPEVAKNKYIKWECVCKTCGQKYLFSSQKLSKAVNDDSNIFCQKCAKQSKRRYKYLNPSLIHTIISGAKRRNIEYDVDLEYLDNLFEEQNFKCALTGIDIVISRNFKHNKSETTASLDRKDNNKGYIKGNVWWVHKRINLMKLKDDSETFINWCRKVVDYNVYDRQMKMDKG